MGRTSRKEKSGPELPYISLTSLRSRNNLICFDSTRIGLGRETSWLSGAYGPPCAHYHLTLHRIYLPNGCACRGTQACLCRRRKRWCYSPQHVEGLFLLNEISDWIFQITVSSIGSNNPPPSGTRIIHALSFISLVASGSTYSFSNLEPGW